MKKILLLAFFCFSAITGCVVPLKVPAVLPGPIEKPNIDFKRLVEFAQAAGNVYQTDEAIQAAYGKNLVIIRNLPQSDGKYFIVLNHKERTQTISIRGTANKTNTWVDLNSMKILDLKLNVQLHKGFKRATDELYADAAPFLQKDYKTRITGHSLGGAMACILMMHLEHDGFQVDQVLTFGQPKVTNEAGGALYKNPHYFRVINGEDLVAHIPPSNVVYDLSGPYAHFGPEINLRADGTWDYSPVQIPKDFIINDNWKNLDLENGVDHQIKNYINRILKINK